MSYGIEFHGGRERGSDSQAEGVSVLFPWESSSLRWRHCSAPNSGTLKLGFWDSQAAFQEYLNALQGKKNVLQMKEVKLRCQRASRRNKVAVQEDTEKR